ncbi:homeobox a10b [Anopheles sinensis]|uniref:Homeobox a10b n=1 Tax=Anopheles sinensis TaxID=74873 RepID=A0A084WF60_ANOSI|nr:homeobox a10b [Anopheles sinensis]
MDGEKGPTHLGALGSAGTSRREQSSSGIGRSLHDDDDDHPAICAPLPCVPGQGYRATGHLGRVVKNAPMERAGE